MEEMENGTKPDLEQEDKPRKKTIGTYHSDKPFVCYPTCCLITLKVILIILLIPVFLVVLILALVLGILLVPFFCLSPCCSPFLASAERYLMCLVEMPVRLMTWILYEDQGSMPREVTCQAPSPTKADETAGEKADLLASDNGQNSGSYGIRDPAE